ncbi:MAG: RmlC-like cupin domain-containing protein [Monoraphidium minutum]|nr:MAG: RmlC-like cupin domain-containing protein [Monoraphidium minutum]
MCSLLSPDADLAAAARPPAHGGVGEASEGVDPSEAASAAAAASYDDVKLEPLSGGPRPLHKRSLAGVRAWQLPNATNQLALMFGPHLDPELSMTFGVEMFEPGHRTTRHIHTAAYEMFVVLGGEGVGISNGDHVPIRAGDVAVFPPHVVHAIDNPGDRRMYCLQMMLPNDMFAEYVTSGSLLGPLDSADMDGIISGSC